MHGDDPLAGLSDETIRSLARLTLSRNDVAPRESDASRRERRTPLPEDVERTEQLLTRDRQAARQVEEWGECLAKGEYGRAAALSSNFELWIATGLGTKAWRRIEDTNAPAMAATKMRMAVQVGSRDSLAWLTSLPAPAEHEERLLWAEGMIHSGLARRAVSVLEEEARRSHSTEVGLLLGEALSSAGQADQAVTTLRRLQPQDKLASAARDIRLAKALFHADQGAEARRILRAAELTLDALPAEQAGRLLGEVSGLRMQLGLRSEPDHTESRFARGARGTIFNGFRLAASGRFRQAASLVRALRQSIELPPGTSVLADIAQGLLRVTRGRYSGLQGLARNLVREAERLENATLYQWAFMLERLVSLSRTMDNPEPAWAPTIPQPTGIPERYLRALRVAHLARRGEAVPDEMLPRAREGDGPLVACVCDFLEAHVRFLSGDPERAAVLAARLTERCVRERFFFLEGEALLIHCFALVGMDRPDELQSRLDALAALAASRRSKRYDVMAQLLRLALDKRPAPQRLLELAGEADASPTAARVAASLLGAAPRLDEMDRLLAQGIQRGWSQHMVSFARLEAPTWAFDPLAGLVFLEEGQVRASPLSMRILSCLFHAACAGQGPVQVDEVAREAWGIEDFHQLRDSKRVHVAVRRLRTVIESDASAPTRLLTVGGGYALSTELAPACVTATGGH